jgi:peptidoglycan/xylan/chitin deacetylase (PgdA/CDA1 family)
MKRIALTFDDGPNSRYTKKILDILKSHRLKVAFFLLGKNVEYYPHLALRIKEEGHLIGNHTYSHKHAKRLKTKSIISQIKIAEDVYKRLLGLKPKFFRPPYGEYDKRLERVIKKFGYRLVLWDACADDWKNFPPEVIADRIISQAKDGAVILLHDGASIRHGESRINTVKALPLIIKRLKEEGFRIVRLDKLY